LLEDLKMNNVVKMRLPETTSEWIHRVHALGAAFAERAGRHDELGQFVARNYDDLRNNHFFSAGIPVELGGGGVGFGEMTEIIRGIAGYCGSTALAFSMHTHPVCLNVFKHLRGDRSATLTLRKIAANELIIATTGGNDWLSSSGTAEKVSGGYLVNAHKRFVSGVPGAQLLVTSAVHEGQNGREVLHFALPLSSEGIHLDNAWNTLGMRGTGSTNVRLENVFVRDEAIVGRRPAGVWHPLWSTIIPIALPLITSAYLGLAEMAAEWAIKAAASHQGASVEAVGHMLNELTIAKSMLADTIRLNENYAFTPSLDLANAVLVRRTIAEGAIRKTVTLAAELVGGQGFFRGHPIERIVRDVQAMQFHPLPFRRQYTFSGRIALGLDPVPQV